MEGDGRENTVELLCVTTPHKRPLPISNHLSKTPKLSQSKLYRGNLSVSDPDHNHFRADSLIAELHTCAKHMQMEPHS